MMARKSVNLPIDLDIALSLQQVIRLEDLLYHLPQKKSALDSDCEPPAAELEFASRIKILPSSPPEPRPFLARPAPNISILKQGETEDAFKPPGPKTPLQFLKQESRGFDSKFRHFNNENVLHPDKMVILTEIETNLFDDPEAWAIRNHRKVRERGKGVKLPPVSEPTGFKEITSPTSKTAVHDVVIPPSKLESRVGGKSLQPIFPTSKPKKSSTTLPFPLKVE
jgi:hypothetical protein